MSAPLTLVIGNKNYSSWSMRPWVLLRAGARSAAAEMHSGFRALRGAMPMNIRSSHPGKGMNPDVAKDIARITAIWLAAKRPYLFGEICAADAFYAPLAMRFVTYAVELKGAAREYQQALLASAAVKAWSADALRETEFFAEDEPYASPPR